MTRNRKPTPTKAMIIKIASELFFENGFSKTTSTEICKKAGISPGNLTFYFPTKEHILAVLVQMMIDLIRANDAEKIQRVFGAYTAEWDGEKFTEIEAIISGIEYATLMHTAHSASLAHRIEGALGSIMLLFGVPEDLRKEKIAKVLAMDYRAIAGEVYNNFKAYVTETNEHALDEVLKHTKVRTYQ